MNVRKINFFEKRFVNERRVVDEIREIHEKQWDMCMTGDKKNFKKNFSSIAKIGSGSYGTAYRVEIAGNKLVIKEARMNRGEELKAERYVKRVDATISELAYPKEYKLLAMVRNLIMKNISPNFVLAYDIGLCEGCVSLRSSSCYLTFMEPADTDLSKINFEREIASDNIVYSIMFQLLLALQAMQSTYGIVHNDIKSNNILIKYIPRGGYMKYTVDNSLLTETFYIENVGVVPMIADFGLSKSVHPKYNTDDDYGVRSVMIERTNDGCGGEFEMLPIIDSTQKSSSSWIDGTKWTFNKVTSRTNLSDLNISSIDVLSDMNKYPALEFYADIMNVIHMFVVKDDGKGGTRIGGDPGRFQKPVNSIPVCLSREITYFDDNMATFAKYRPFLVNAVLMLKQFYIDTRKPGGEYDLVKSFRST